MSTPIVTFAKPVTPLPRLTTPGAADLAAKFKPQPGAQALVKPGMSSSEYIHVLEQKNMSGDAIKGLAHGMSERDSVWYAAQSSRRVEPMMTPADKTAMKAAEDWAKNPSPANQARASAAAAATDHSGPGAWAAQGAAWSSETPGGAVPATPGLTPHATANSVQLASAMEAKGGPIEVPKVPETPEAPTLPDQPAAPQLAMPEVKAPEVVPPTVPPTPEANAKTAQAQQPYVTLGKDVASGKNTPA